MTLSQIDMENVEEAMRDLSPEDTRHANLLLAGRSTPADEPTPESPAMSALASAKKPDPSKNWSQVRTNVLPNAVNQGHENGLSSAAQKIYKNQTGMGLKERVDKLGLKDSFRSALLYSEEGPRVAKEYDPKNCLPSLFSWHCTAVKLVIKKVDFWALLLTHILLQVLYYGLEYGKCKNNEDPSANINCWTEINVEEWPQMTVATLMVVGSFITFFVVFFNGQAYTRFFQEYFICCKIRYNVNDTFFLLRLHIDEPAVQFTTLRLMHAAVYLGYAFLAQNKELNGFVPSVYRKLVKMKLITDRESIRLRSMRYGSPSTECLLWAMREVRQLMDDAKLKPPIYRAVESKMMAIRGLFDEFKSYNDQPIPFLYYHLVNVIVEMYLIVMCYAGTFVTPYYSIIGFLGSLLALLGLREAAACLADPLGQDDTDIPVFLMVTDTHFEHLYTIVRLGNRSPTVELLPGFGNHENLERVAKGFNMANYSGERPHVPKPEEPTGFLAPSGQNARFWTELISDQVPTSDYIRKVGRSRSTGNMTENLVIEEAAASTTAAGAAADDDDDIFEEDDIAVDHHD